MLRKAGAALNNFARKVDDDYSEAIMNMYLGPKGNERSYADNPVLGTAAAVLGTFGGGTPASHMRGNSFEKGAAISSLLARYAAPGVGITLAGKGLYDISQNMMGGEQTSGTVMPQ